MSWWEITLDSAMATLCHFKWLFLGWLVFYVWSASDQIKKFWINRARKHAMAKAKRRIEYGYNLEAITQAAVRELIEEGKLDGSP